MVPVLKERTLCVQIDFKIMEHLKIDAHLESLYPIIVGNERKADQIHIRYNTALTLHHQFVTQEMHFNSFQELWV